MAKTKKTKSQAAQPSYLDDLLANGMTLLKAESLDKLAEIVDGIPADIRYAAGAVGHDREHSLYSLRIDLVDN